MRVLRPLLYLFGLLSLLFLLLNMSGSISDSNPIPASALPAPVMQRVSYTKEIQPILESKCLACHSCFDAPCQFKLENTEGLLRGAIHEEIYDGARTEAMPPTRLGIDELTIDGWRERGFFSVLHAEDEQSHPSCLACFGWQGSILSHRIVNCRI